MGLLTDDDTLTRAGPAWCTRFLARRTGCFRPGGPAAGRLSRVAAAASRVIGGFHSEVPIAQIHKRVHFDFRKQHPQRFDMLALRVEAEPARGGRPSLRLARGLGELADR